jgi:protein transport protein SEC61 subunit gamma-like protein
MENEIEQQGVEQRNESDVHAEAQEVREQPEQESKSGEAREEKKGIFGAFGSGQKKTSAFGGAGGQPKKGILSGVGGILSKFISDSRRIFIVSKKPTMEEYRRMALIVALGIALIGVIGFIMTLTFSLTGIGF